MSDGPQTSERRTLSAAPRSAPKPQHIARFRTLGKLGFPNVRREADALHRRWEAKRSSILLLTLGQGPGGQELLNRKRHLAANSRAATCRKASPQLWICAVRAVWRLLQRVRCANSLPPLDD